MNTATKPRRISSPLVRFARDGQTFTAEAARLSSEETYTVKVWTGYPREELIGSARNIMRLDRESVTDMAARIARTIIDDGFGA